MEHGEPWPLNMVLFHFFPFVYLFIAREIMSHLYDMFFVIGPFVSLGCSPY